jgi:hypothetical protein
MGRRTSSATTAPRPPKRRHSSKFVSTSRGPVITVQYKPCGQHGELDRKALVKQFGASMRFVDLRRRMAMGCDKMHCSDGQDKCGTGFPCLLEAAVVLELQKPT